MAARLRAKESQVATLAATESRTYLDYEGLVELVGKLNATLVASGDVRVVKALTEAEYDALATKEPNVLYVITEE